VGEADLPLHYMLTLRNIFFVKRRGDPPSGGKILDDPGGSPLQ